MMKDIVARTDMNITLTPESRVHEVDFNDLQFGKTFSDHMFRCIYENGEWQEAEIVPFGPIEISPATNVLHYAQTVFEGMKAFYKDENTINLFRPEAHHQRFNNSCRRVCIPETDYETFISALDNLIRLDNEWVPRKPGTALYIRPFIFASEDLLAARVSGRYSFYIITSPVGAYYKEGFKPVKLTTPDGYIRAVKGGTGESKTGGNYAASFLPARKAQQQGYTQVLWLDAIENKYIEEVGTMNIHFMIGDTLVTPKLTGSILPGITRRSILTLAKDWGYNVEERRISIDEVFDAYDSGDLKEVFGSGTAAVVSPVGLIEHNGRTLTLDQEEPGEFTKRCYDEITDIQYGRIEDRYGWVHSVEV